MLVGALRECLNPGVWYVDVFVPKVILDSAVVDAPAPIAVALAWRAVAELPRVVEPAAVDCALDPIAVVRSPVAIAPVP